MLLNYYFVVSWIHQFLMSDLFKVLGLQSGQKLTGLWRFFNCRSVSLVKLDQ